jgi:capsular exopolysaccharide synthesis family protein
VSKFFKALENAERERETQRDTSAPPEEAAAAGPGAEPIEAAVPLTPAATAAAAAVTAPAPATPAPSPSVFTRPPASPRPAATEPPPAYGAPSRREAGPSAAHHRAVGGLLEPAAVTEPGELDDHLVSLLAPTSHAAEQYRTVRLHIETLRRERDIRLVGISSPTRGDGKTISAINVAGALAQAPDARVALVEADVRHPGVARFLGLSASRGLSGYLMDHAMTVDAVLERPSGVGFAVVVAGPASSMPYELLKSPRLRSLFAALRERFDFVVVDTPPVLPFPDVGLVRDLVDGFLLVVRANRTPREMVRDGLGAIGADRVLGVIFNDDERPGMDGDDAGWRSYLARPLGGSRAA